MASIQESVDVEALRENPAGEYVPETSEMGEDVSYEPQVALVGLADGARAEDVIQGLAERSGVDPANFEAHEFSSGYLHISLPEGMDVARAMQALGSLETVSAAQPNYYLTVASDAALTSDEGKKPAQAPTDELDPAQPANSTGQGSEPASMQETSDPQPSERAGTEQADTASSEMGVETKRVDDANKADDLESSDKEHAAPTSGEGGKPSLSEESAATEGVVSPQLDAQGVTSDTTANGIEAQSVAVNDRFRSEQWGLDSISANDAWSLTKVNRSVTVAVLDLGFEVDHPDLKQNLVPGYNSYIAVRGQGKARPGGRRAQSCREGKARQGQQRCHKRILLCYARTGCGLAVVCQERRHIWYVGKVPAA